MFHKKEAADGAMTPCLAVCTALARTVGTGNFAGVAGAIAIGGPGAVFWMWCSALLGMCTKYAGIIIHTAWFDDKKSLLSVDAADISPGKCNQAIFRQIHVCFVNFFF